MIPFFCNLIALAALSLFLVGCTRHEPTLDSLFGGIEERIQNVPEKREDSAIEALEENLEAILSHSEFPSLPQKKIDLLLQAIEGFQIGYFIHPTIPRLQRLQECYLIFDKAIWDKKANYQEFSRLRSMIELIVQRSQIAKESIPSLLEYWAKNPENRDNLIQEIQQRWEVGGICLKKNSHSWEIVCLEDQENKKNKQYVAEFKKNQFQNLPILEQRFLNRLELRKIKADSQTIAYSNVIINKTKEKFALIRALAQKDSLTETEREILEKAKKKLYFFGLEKMLIRHSYFLDVPKYLYNKELVFFFHTHPHDPRIFYPKKPSGQDKATSFRSGPMLVFDIQKDHLDVYSVILGETEKIQTFYFEK
ncbi:MAG: hypothetical protein HUU50_00105 [Candidatus Brocadiae bacterium]|nr:hypothetical protein [Candidatus Brocadiia bacterium]